MNKKSVVSSCCESHVHFMPPSLGEPGQYYCSRCSKFCDIKIKIKEKDQKND